MSVEARLLTTVEEFAAAVRLQQQIWGFSDVELLPVRLFVVASKIGGQSFGAYDQGRMVAFTIAIPGLKKTPCGPKPYLHSHMLGVCPEYRDRGVGRLLKYAQRERAIADGFDLMEWTFDPLELKNAYFNLERLGAVVRRYVLNQYGTTTSPLHGGMPTDRCVAEWYLLRDCRVQAPVEDRIDVPADIEEIRRRDVPRARAIQKGVSDRFVECFGRGLTVIGFEGPGTYLLGRPADDV
ncbi:MAG TPA: GNAT family N-acetyltransferase [Bryobacteraceae bacterium]|nr:GNAT family N-acetyltransferase [Bryobacteraceae bacterium]